jgi:hypothetical protein
MTIEMATGRVPHHNKPPARALPLIAAGVRLPLSPMNPETLKPKRLANPNPYAPFPTLPYPTIPYLLLPCTLPYSTFYPTIP